MGVPTYSSIANANDIRETAISVFPAFFLLADSTGAAHCNNRDFGTSRRQLSDQAIRRPVAAEGARARKYPNRAGPDFRHRAGQIVPSSLSHADLFN
jgi:hypothetical protein